MHTFVLNKSFGQLLNVSPKSFIFLKPFNSEFLYIEVWFTDQNSKPLEIEDSVQPRDWTFVKGYEFFSFAKNMAKNIGKNLSKSLCGKYS